jgi:hypothetical protein
MFRMFHSPLVKMTHTVNGFNTVTGFNMKYHRVQKALEYRSTAEDTVLQSIFARDIDYIPIVL